MWSFKRRKNQIDKVVPEEVQQYYNSEHRERALVAWLLALGTLVVTIAVALGLFWGGRWTYRKLANKNTPPSPAQVSQNPQTGQVTTTPSPGTTTPPPTSTSPVATPSANPPVSTTHSSDTPVSTNLPNTGPAGTLTAFVVTTVAATGLYQLRMRRIQSKK